MSENQPSNPWERRPDEPLFWFRRFERFRLLGTGRSLNAAVNAERVAKGLEESQHAPGSWRKACEVWDWRARADAWDQYLVEQAEAKWTAMIMGSSETLARLSEQARSSIADFISETQIRLPAARAGESEVIIASGELDWEAVHKLGHLIKKISFNQYGPILELHDRQSALQLLGKHHGLFNDRSLNIDLSKLTDEQLGRLAAGEDIVHVLATSGSSGA